MWQAFTQHLAVRVLVLVVLGALQGHADTGAVELVFLPADQNHYFIDAGPFSTSYLHLKRDGRYRCTTSEHVEIWERDRGTWSQGTDGVIRFVSEMRERDAAQGAMQVFAYICRKPEAAAALRAFLAAHSHDVFPTRQVTELRYRDSRENDGRSFIDVRFYNETVPRSDLEELLAQMEAYPTDPTTNVLRATPLRYKGVTFLHMHDGGLGLRNRVADVIGNFDERGFDMCTYVQAGRVRFWMGAWSFKPFVALPWMNAVVMPWWGWGVLLGVFIGAAALMQHLVAGRGRCPVCGRSLPVGALCRLRPSARVKCPACRTALRIRRCGCLLWAGSGIRVLVILLIVALLATASMPFIMLICVVAALISLQCIIDVIEARVLCARGVIEADTNSLA